MRLYVQVIEARGLPAMDLNGLSDPYVRLQLGKQRAKTKVVKKSLNPFWDEEFNFRVGDLKEELIILVLDEDKYFSDDSIGQVKLPLAKVLDAENLSLGSAWYQLQPKSKKSKNKECGEIRLTLSLSQSNPSCDGTPPRTCSEDLTSHSDKSSELKRESLSVESNGKIDSYSVSEAEEAEPDKEEKSQSRAFFDRMFQIFSGKSTEITKSTSRDIDFVEVIQEEPLKPEATELADDTVSNSTFDELLKILESKDQGGEMPENLTGGVILDQSYAVSPSELNTIIFSPNSNFLQSLAEIQGTTDLNIEPWRFENGESLKRVVTYIKAATKLVKAVKATEEQIYLKADGKNYSVLASVSTPDVPFGSYFRCEVLYCIMPGPQLPSEEESSRLVVSWRINFFQSTMMKGMIENGAKQGLKDSYVQFAELLSKNAKPLDLKDVESSKEQILASLQTEQESDWKLACRFFGNFTVISSIFVGLYVTVHILLANRSMIQGLEFTGLDLPDSIGEVVVCGVLVLQGERVLKMIGRFLQARKKRESDHGIKAQGDGWLLTVALIEGSDLAAVDSSGYSDPYVAFTCHGKTKTSSIKFQTLDPHWNEIFEFDAMIDPPSTMEINVYDFDGPFDEAVSLGHAEVNFLKSNLSELADAWISLEGKLAQACQSKLHLRIFLNNTRGVQVVSDYLTKMEKEVGKKINLRSPQTNSAFQKLFGLPPEEFLINDFTCHLKRKMPIQGRLFLSPRIIGFYTNLFGHKIKFFFLWEDIEDIQVVPPSLTSMGSPSLLIILRRGRGLDARHGAKSLDPDGRLKFQFQSFVSFNVANRTIMALWKAKSLSPEQKVRIVEEESEEKELHSEESGSFLGVEDAKMSEVFSSIVPVPLNSLMEIFDGDSLEQKVMEKVGCVDYSATPWESVSPDVHQRQVNYKFDKNISRYGGEVTSTQQRSRLHDKNGWLIEEVMTLQGVLLGDYFTLHLRYQIDDLQSKSKACHVLVSLGIAWLKSTKHQKRITKNVIANSSTRLKEMFRLVEKEFSTGK
ncbi:C2 and GRAM domain-containing protein At1g03370 isoform X2 [Dendrobium catenatum]|uniref:C2 and GRAM domain-containing protein n=1 Tax=Dendrobium catenatum TaxID=906689 RepID=A0A2I0W1Z5_9ASPA|nr:C2 and GRAM domain-containing protein At1g03370 isoform X2 [Dendrobium catenatum]PKU69690.1 C2 and GRAM domain-containing protein [Dendrobium catenatum]